LIALVVLSGPGEESRVHATEPLHLSLFQARNAVSGGVSGGGVRHRLHGVREYPAFGIPRAAEAPARDASGRTNLYMTGYTCLRTTGPGRQFVTFKARVSSGVLIGAILEFVPSWAALPETAPTLITPPRDASEYYPPASLRSGETGRVVLGFMVDAEGKAIEPFTLDGTSGSSSYRLIVAAERYIRDSRFGTGPHYTKRLTASFVFEIAPCGVLTHSVDPDYTIDLCRDPPPPSHIPQP